MALDPDDPRPPYLQVAASLRAEILTRRFAPGDRLPSGSELSRHYGVARMTIQQALRLLKEEGLIVARQGSGVFVRARTEKPIGLRPHLEQAFEQPQVSIDFAGFSGETLHGAIQEPLDKIRAGRLSPESITIRALLPDTSSPMAVPTRTDGGVGDDPQLRERARQIVVRHAQPMVESVHELEDLELVKRASVQLRVHRFTPTFKLYVLNNEQAFFGFYPIRQHTVSVSGKKRSIYDVLGKDIVLFHFVADADDTSTGSQYVAQAKMWFESIWTTVSQDFTP